MLRVAATDEEDLVRMVIDFANGWDPGVDDASFDSEVARASFERTLERYYAVGDVEELREEITKFLKVAVNYYDPRLTAHSGRTAMQDLLRKRLSKIKLAASLDFEDDFLEPNVTAVPNDIEQACWIVVALCLDQSWGFNERLSFCEERGCYTLILQNATGRPVQRCDPCRLKRTRRQTRERVRRSRGAAQLD